MIVLWQKHQQAPGKADLGRQACALGANRVLDDLHHQRLSLKYLFFNRHLRLAFSGEHGGLAAILALPHIGHMQERRALQTDVDEGRLHARQHARNLPQIHIAHQAALERAFEVQLLHGAMLHHGNAGFLGRPVDQDVLLHEGVNLVLGVKRRSPLRAAIVRSRTGADP